MNMNESVVRRFGEMSLSLCEAETVIAAKDQRIKELEDALLRAAESVDGGAKAKTGAEEMLESR